MAHFCVFWRGICTFGEEFVCFGEEILARPPPAGKSFPKILARPPWAGKIFNFSPPNPPRPNWRGKIPRPRHSPPLNFSPRRGLVQSFMACETITFLLLLSSNTLTHSLTAMLRIVDRARCKELRRQTGRRSSLMEQTP